MSASNPFSVSASLVTMFIASSILVILFAGILQQIGAPLIFISMLMCMYVIAIYAFSGLFAKTMRFSTFQNADKMFRPTFCGMAIAAGTLSGGAIILQAGNVFSTGTDFLALFSGILLGLSLMVVTFSASVARSKATSFTQLLFPDGSSKLAITLSVLIVVSSSVFLLIAQLKLLGLFVEGFFGIAFSTGTTLVVLTATACLIAGGMQSLSVVRMLSYPAIALAVFVPLMWISYNTTGNPIPQLSFGAGPLASILEIDKEMLEASLASKADVFDPTREAGSLTGFNFIAALLTLAFGISAMPQLLQHIGTVSKGRDGRKSGIWAVVFVAVVLSAIPAIAIFAKLYFYTSLLGLQISELSAEVPWIFSLSGSGTIPLIKICGDLVANTQEAFAACGQSQNQFLSLNNLQINPDYLMLGFGIVGELPSILTIIIAAGALLAIFSTVDGLLLVSANTITTDIYRRIARPKSPSGVQLFMNRFFLLLIAGVSILLVQNVNLDALLLFNISLSLTAACLFPALLCRLWVKKSTDSEIGFSMLLTFIFVVATMALMNLGPDLIPGTGDEIKLVLPGTTYEIHPLSTGMLGAFLYGIIFMILRFALSYRVKGLSANA